MGKQVTVVQRVDISLPNTDLYTVGRTVILSTEQYESLPEEYVERALTGIIDAADPSTPPSGGGGAAPETVVSASTSYSANAGDVVLADPGGGNFGVSLPAPTLGARVTIKNLANSNSVTVLPYSTEHIDGATSKTVAPRQAYVLVSDGTDWWIV